MHDLTDLVFGHAAAGRQSPEAKFCCLAFGSDASDAAGESGDGVGIVGGLAGDLGVGDALVAVLDRPPCLDLFGGIYQRDGVSIDVLAPEGLGSRTDLTTTPPGRTLQVPGGTQALEWSG